MILQTTRLGKVVKIVLGLKIEQVGVAVQVGTYPLHKPSLGWRNGCVTPGLHASDDAIRYLAERIEGNLLAAAQEITKLQLLYAQQRIEVSDIQAVVADSARFTVFDLVDAVLSQIANLLTYFAHSTRRKYCLNAGGMDVKRFIAAVIQWQSKFTNGAIESGTFGENA